MVYIFAFTMVYIFAGAAVTKYPTPSGSSNRSQLSRILEAGISRLAHPQGWILLVPSGSVQLVPVTLDWGPPNNLILTCFPL